MSNEHRFDESQALKAIDDLFDAGQITDATYQCGADIIELCNEENDEESSFLSELIAKTQAQMKQWRVLELKDWENDLTVEEWSQRFDVGDGMIYANTEELLEATDWNFLESLVKALWNKTGVSLEEPERYSQKSRKSAADRLNNLLENGEWNIAEQFALTVMMLGIEAGFDESTIDKCTESEEFLADHLPGFAAACWDSKDVTENAPFLLDLREWIDGNPDAFRKAVDWRTMWRAWSGAALKLNN